MKIIYLLILSIMPLTIYSQNYLDYYLKKPNITLPKFDGIEEYSVFEEAYYLKKSGKKVLLNSDTITFDKIGNLVSMKSLSKKWHNHTTFKYETDVGMVTISITDQNILNPIPTQTAVYLDTLGRPKYLITYVERSSGDDSIIVNFDSMNRITSVFSYYRPNIFYPRSLSEIEYYYYVDSNLVRFENWEFTHGGEVISKKDIHTTTYSPQGKRIKARFVLNQGSKYEYSILNEYLRDDQNEKIIKVTNSNGNLLHYARYYITRGSQ